LWGAPLPLTRVDDDIAAATATRGAAGSRRANSRV
jgi:hypothetical protein